jgi:hypothetical protein
VKKRIRLNQLSGQGPRAGLAWAPFPNLYPDWRYLFY